MKITKEEFTRYESIRQSGVINMNLIGNISRMSGLSVEKIREIIQHYNDLDKKYPEVRKAKLIIDFPQTMEESAIVNIEDNPDEFYLGKQK